MAKLMPIKGTVTELSNSTIGPCTNRYRGMAAALGLADRGAGVIYD